MGGGREGGRRGQEIAARIYHRPATRHLPPAAILTQLTPIMQLVHRLSRPRFKEARSGEDVAAEEEEEDEKIVFGSHARALRC